MCRALSTQPTQWAAAFSLGRVREPWVSVLGTRLSPRSGRQHVALRERANGTEPLRDADAHCVGSDKSTALTQGSRTRSGMNGVSCRGCHQRGRKSSAPQQLVTLQGGRVRGFAQHLDEEGSWSIVGCDHRLEHGPSAWSIADHLQRDAVACHLMIKNTVFVEQRGQRVGYGRAW